MERHCKPCEKGMPSMKLEKARREISKLPGWQIAQDGKSIFKDFVMKDFMAGVQLIQRIAELAEEEDHHPDLHLTGYRKLRVELATHAIGGLSGNDFILAEKIEAIAGTLPGKS